MDNNSSDRTSEVVLETYEKLGIAAGNSILLHEKRQGKANAMKKAFYNLKSDVFLLVDADNTYPASAVHDLLKPVLNDEADIVIGDRHSAGGYGKENKRPLHGFGNNLVKHLINFLFGSNLKDILSGYRIMTSEFVKNFPIISKGFEIETEMTLFSLDKGYRVLELPVNYIDRPDGSVSKLNTYTDGFKVLKSLAWIFKDYRPLLFFGFLSIVFILIGIIIGVPPVIEYLKFKYVYKVPSAILAMGFVLLGVLLSMVGLILDTVVSIEKRNFEKTKIKH